WVLGGNNEDDPVYRERFLPWVHEHWTEEDRLIEKMKAQYATTNL
ncbi:acyltransferase, partial [Acinetobacter nosocomialis]